MLSYSDISTLSSTKLLEIISRLTFCRIIGINDRTIEYWNTIPYLSLELRVVRKWLYLSFLLYSHAKILFQTRCTCNETSIQTQMLLLQVENYSLCLRYDLQVLKFVCTTKPIFFELVSRDANDTVIFFLWIIFWFRYITMCEIF